MQKCRRDFTDPFVRDFTDRHVFQIVTYKIQKIAVFTLLFKLIHGKASKFSSVTSSAEALPLASGCGRLKLCGAGGVKTWEETEGLQGVSLR